MHLMVPRSSCVRLSALCISNDTPEPRLLPEAFRLNDRASPVSSCPVFAEELLVLQLFPSFLLFQFVDHSHSPDFQLVEILSLHHPRRERLLLDFF